jgi:hypothetical protein
MSALAVSGGCGGNGSRSSIRPVSKPWRVSPTIASDTRICRTRDGERVKKEAQFLPNVDCGEKGILRRVQPTTPGPPRSKRVTGRRWGLFWLGKPCQRGWTFGVGRQVVVGNGGHRRVSGDTHHETVAFPKLLGYRRPGANEAAPCTDGAER